MRPKKIVVNDDMQKKYVYYLTEPVGKNFDPQFTPDLTPKQMLKLGVFGGKYLGDCQREFPKDWFRGVEFSPEFHNAQLNYFKINASQSLAEWQRRGWIYHEDPRGWFQWYCRYYMGRRCRDDARQIRRWRAIRRHVTQIRKNCRKGDFSCRPRQRQAVLHWAYDSRKI